MERNKEVTAIEKKLLDIFTKYERSIMLLQSILLWEVPHLSVGVFVGIHFVFWFLTSSTKRVIYLLAVTTMLLYVFCNEIWPLILDSNVFSTPQYTNIHRYRRLCYWLAELLVTFKKYSLAFLRLRRNKPVKFCVVVTVTCACFSMIGRYVSDVIISYFIIMILLLWPCADYHDLTKNIRPIFEPFTRLMTTLLQETTTTSNTGKYPRTWDTSDRRLVNVHRRENYEEYNEIETLFQQTLDVPILKLERIQNKHFWENFTRKKEVMMKENSSFWPVEERRLFHGTDSDKIDDICRENFDFRLSGTRVGAIYGQGAYFASTSRYSNDFVQADSCCITSYGGVVNLKRMFVARVLVGSYTFGSRDMRKPPYKNPSNKTLGCYDSCVDNVGNPTIFVTFDNNQVYPEYLITYKY